MLKVLERRRMNYRRYFRGIDFACIHESRLHPNQSFFVRGYEALRHDREGSRKDGVLTFVKTYTPAIENVINTEGEA